MDCAIHKLVKIQELELVIEESNILHGNQDQCKSEMLRREVERLIAAVPVELMQRYSKLRRAGLAIVAEKAGICQGCRLNIPKGDLIRMRAGNMEAICPNCGRFLLVADV